MKRIKRKSVLILRVLSCQGRAELHVCESKLVLAEPERSDFIGDNCELMMPCFASLPLLQGIINHNDLGLDISQEALPGAVFFPKKLGDGGEVECCGKQSMINDAGWLQTSLRVGTITKDTDLI